MASPYFSGQALQTGNPLRGIGWTNIGLALLKIVPALVAIGHYGSIVQGFSQRAPADEVFFTVVLLVASILVGTSGVRQFVRGIGQIGALIVPPRAPADFASYQADVLVPLQRRELPAYQLPDSGKYWLAHRLFPNRFPLLSQRMRGQLALAVSAGQHAVTIAITALVGVWAAGFGSRQVPGRAIAVIAVLVALLLVAAGIRLAFVSAQFTRLAPAAERDEFRLTMAGGGDPNQIPIGIEYELMALRPASGAPNRGARIGFAMTGGGVKNAGDYHGDIVVETQPDLAAAGEAEQAPLVIGAAVVFTIIGVYLALAEPSFRLIGGFVSGADVVTWIIRMIGAALLLGAAGGIIGQVEHFKSVFRFTSLAVAVRVEGTYGRADIKVGKGMHDSIQSENTVVRSDSAVVGYVARIESESVGLLGHRSIVSMSGDERTGSIQATIEKWFETFRSKGADIMGVELGSEKLARMMQANVAISAQRAGASAGAIAAAPVFPTNYTPAAIVAGTEMDPSDADAGTASRAGVAETSGDDKICPECAEKIKAAARKCRFCGYRYDDPA